MTTLFDQSPADRIADNGLVRLCGMAPIKIESGSVAASQTAHQHKPRVHTDPAWAPNSLTPDVSCSK